MTKPILVFDGDCGFCTTAANFVLRRSKTDIEIIPWQFADLGTLGLSQAEASAKVQLVISGTHFSGHLCFAKLLELQPIPLRSLGWLLRTEPVSSLARFGYWLIARYRHRLPGGTPACNLNTD